jgi:hypothetical protein
VPTVGAAFRPKPLGTILLLFLAAFLYALMMANLIDASRTDAAGRGLNLAFAALVGAVLWIVLAVLLIVAAVRGSMPGAAKIAAGFLLPLSAVAAFMSVEFDSGRGGMSILVPVLLPVLIALYALWARLPAARAKFPASLASAVLGGAILLVSLAPLAVAVVDSLPNPARDARLRDQEKARQERQRQEERAEREREAVRFARLNPDSSLRDYLEYLPGGDTRSQQALQGARLVKSRQADAVALLKAGEIGALTDLWRLALEPTALLCAGYGAALDREATKINRTTGADYLSIAMDLERQLPNIKWLVDAHCDLGDTLGRLEARIRDVSDSERMERFAATLEALHKASR